MSKKMLYALILICATVLVLMFTRGETEIRLVKWPIQALTSVILLVFTGVGVVIGVLLK